jgi:hypothetical protein
MIENTNISIIPEMAVDGVLKLRAKTAPLEHPARVDRARYDPKHEN